MKKYVDPERKQAVLLVQSKKCCCFDILKYNQGYILSTRRGSGTPKETNMAVLSWGDIETNAIAFSKRWKDCKGDEKQESQTFEKELMSVFGVDWREGLHEHRIVNEDGVQNYIDYIL